MKTREQLEKKATAAIANREPVAYAAAEKHSIAPARMNEPWFHAEVMLQIANADREYSHLREEVYA